MLKPIHKLIQNLWDRLIFGNFWFMTSQPEQRLHHLLVTEQQDLIITTVDHEIVH